MADPPLHQDGAADSRSRRSSHQGVGCCEHGGWFGLGRSSSGLSRSVLAWRHPTCACCGQRKGGFHPGVDLHHALLDAQRSADRPDAAGVQPAP